MRSILKLLDLPYYIDSSLNKEYSSIDQSYDSFSQIMKVILYIFTLIFIASAGNVVYERVMLDDQQALCLDGSKGAYYSHIGDPKKVLLFFEGGAWCGDSDLPSTLENCYKRSKSDLGSSTSYPAFYTWSNGIFSDDAENYFSDWTRIYLKYCDGSGHQGTKSSPILYKGAELYFRGQNITIAQFESINKKLGIFEGKVSHLVLSGQSAGGLAVLHWSNYLQDKVKKPTKLFSIPDSPIFLDIQNSQTQTNTYRTSFQTLLKISNEQTGTPISGCNNEYNGQLWRCMFAQNIVNYIKSPLFIVQSLYDSWGLYYIAGIRCITGQKSLLTCTQKQMQIIQSYRQKTMNVLFRYSEREANGVWAPVCINHCYLSNQYYTSKDYMIPQESGYSIVRSIKDWIEGAEEDPRHLDFGTWPDNRPCSGL